MPSAEIQPLATKTAVKADEKDEDEDESSQATSSLRDSGMDTGLHDERASKYSAAAAKSTNGRNK